MPACELWRLLSKVQTRRRVKDREEKRVSEVYDGQPVHKASTTQTPRAGNYATGEQQKDGEARGNLHGVAMSHAKLCKEIFFRREAGLGFGLWLGLECGACLRHRWFGCGGRCGRCWGVSRGLLR